MPTTTAEKNVIRNIFNELVAEQGFSDKEKGELLEKIEATIMLTAAAELFTALDEDARAEIPDANFSSYKSMFEYLSKNTPREFFTEVVANSIESVFAEFLSNLK